MMPRQATVTYGRDARSIHMGMKQHNTDMETGKASMDEDHPSWTSGAKTCKPTRTLTFQSDFLGFSWRLSVLLLWWILLSVLIRDVKGVTAEAAASDWGGGGGHGDHNTGGEYRKRACLGGARMRSADPLQEGGKRDHGFEKEMEQFQKCN